MRAGVVAMACASGIHVPYDCVIGLTWGGGLV